MVRGLSFGPIEYGRSIFDSVYGVAFFIGHGHKLIAIAPGVIFDDCHKNNSGHDEADCARVIVHYIIQRNNNKLKLKFLRANVVVQFHK
jgi:hypothetical protein